MKKWLVFAVLFLAVALIGRGDKKGEDVGRLMPVQLLMADYRDGNVVLQTDTGHSGTGKNLEAALLDMNRAAEGKLFLDTADYLLIRKNALPLVPELSKYLRPSCTMCRYTGKIDPVEAVPYLQYHTPSLTIGMYQTEENELPLLASVEGRMELEQ